MSDKARPPDAISAGLRAIFGRSEVISHRFGAQLPDGWDQELFSQIRTSTVGYRVRGITAIPG